MCRENATDDQREIVLAGRCSVLQRLLSVTKGENEDIQALLHETLIRRSKIGRSMNIIAFSESSLQAAAKLTASKIDKSELVLERARVAQHFGQLRSAQYLLQDLERQIECAPGHERFMNYCQTLILLGDVIQKTKVDPSGTVLEKYYKKSIRLLEEHIESFTKSQLERDSVISVRELGYQQIASVSDQLYREIKTFLHSEEVVRRRKNIKLTIEKGQHFENIYEKSKRTDNESRKKSIVHLRNAKLDQDNLKEKETEMNDLLLQAVEYYLHCMCLSSKADLPVYRMVSLWLENSWQKGVNCAVKSAWPSIKRHKLVSLLYQLVARLSLVKNDFSTVLNTVVMDIVSSHPHHGLPVLFMMAHAHYDDLLKSSTKSKKHSLPSTMEEDRVKAAKHLVEILKKNKNLKEHICEMECVWQAYLRLANWGEGILPANNSNIDVPSDQPLMKFRNLKFTTPFSLPIEVQPSGVYEVPTLSHWDKQISTVGGINVPKRLKVHASNGLSFYELLKGKDDLRQDAVLEQVFCTVNKLFKNNANARHQRLSVRTYIVTPLSQATGLVQWCSNSVSLGDYITDSSSPKSKGLHPRYYPNDWNENVCRKEYANCSKKPFAQKLEKFKEILSHYHPVLGYMFHELSSSPKEWYERRQAYTKSLAASCAAGYVLGLGDRHTHNILVDKQTCEIIPIDLGVAFDTGKILPTPETVPFRLSQVSVLMR